MNEPVKKEDSFNYYTDLPVGEILRRARLHYGQSLADVESILRIRASQLEAIETGHPEKLPGRVYAIGFVRSYSEYLGLDGDKMVQLFKVQSLGSKERPELHFPVPASESKVPNIWVIASSIAGIILIGIIWAMLSGGSDSTEDINQIPPVPEELKVEAEAMPELEFVPGIIGEAAQMEGEAPEGETVAEAPEASPAELTDETQEITEPVEVAEPEHRVTIEVSERSWVEIRDENGKVILSRTLEPGNTYYVPRDKEGLILTTGNAGGLIINVDGEKLPPFGKRGDVRRNIPLQAEKLKKLFN